MTSSLDHPASTSVSSAGIDALCDEILLQIIQWVFANTGRSNLFNLALCSRRFFKLAEPVLYSQFDERRLIHVQDRRCPAVFLERILARPDLALCLKRLSGAACVDRPACLPLSDCDFNGENWTRIRTIVNDASRSEIEAVRWMKAIKTHHWAAVMSLIVSLCPNLEEVEFHEWAFHNDDYGPLIEAFERAHFLQGSCEESRFSMSKVKSIAVSYYDTEDGLSFEQVTPFLNLKSVESFHGHMISEESSVEMDPPHTFATKELTFTCSAISELSLAQILRSFPQLERFTYQFGGSIVGYAGFEPPRLMPALEHLKPCLKELTLLAEEWPGVSDLEGYPIGSLADFQKLVTINVNASILIGSERSDDEDSVDNADENDSDNVTFTKSQNLADAVPPSLESLSLVDCESCVPRHIFELVRQKPWRTPSLKKLDLGWQGVKHPGKDGHRALVLHPGFNKDEAETLIAECATYGVDLAVAAAE